MQSRFASELVKVHYDLPAVHHSAQYEIMVPRRDAVAMSHEAAPRRASMTSTASVPFLPDGSGRTGWNVRAIPIQPAVLEWQRNDRNHLRRRN
jgi:hypothetical protein